MVVSLLLEQESYRLVFARKLILRRQCSIVLHSRKPADLQATVKLSPKAWAQIPLLFPAIQNHLGIGVSPCKNVKENRVSQII